MTKKQPWFMGKYFIITGGSSGIGLGLSKELLLNGAKVIIVSYDPNEFEVARKELVEYIPDLDVDANVKFYKCDVTSAEDRIALREQLEKQNLEMVGLINNAGITTWGPFFKTPSKEIERLMRVNFVGSVMCTRDFFPLCLKPGLENTKEVRYIVFMSSTSGIVPFPFIGGYSGTKKGVEFFLQSLANELPKNVKMIRMRPGTVETNLYKNAPKTDGCNAHDIIQMTADMKQSLTVEDITKPLVKAIIKKKSKSMYPNLKTRLFYNMLVMPLFGKHIMRFATRKMEAMFETDGNY